MASSSVRATVVWFTRQQFAVQENDAGYDQERGDEGQESQDEGGAARRYSSSRSACFVLAP